MNKRYNVNVNFTTTMNVVVYAKDEQAAEDYAKHEAVMQFDDLLKEGQYFTSDFDVEVEKAKEV